MMLGRQRIAVGLAIWLALIGGLTCWDSSQQPPHNQRDASAEQSADQSTVAIVAPVSAEERIADYTSALATWTTVLGVATVLLWLTSIGIGIVQHRDTKAAIDLSRDEFIASHRPRVIVRFVQGPFNDPTDGCQFVWVTIANIGETPAAIREIGADLARRNPHGNDWAEPGINAGVKPFFRVLTSGEAYTFQVKAAALADEWPRPLELCAVGTIRYTDARGVLRETGFFRIQSLRGRFLSSPEDGDYAD